MNNPQCLHNSLSVVTQNAITATGNPAIETSTWIQIRKEFHTLYNEHYNLLRFKKCVSKCKTRFFNLCLSSINYYRFGSTMRLIGFAPKIVECCRRNTRTKTIDCFLIDDNNVILTTCGIFCYCLRFVFYR